MNIVVANAPDALACIKDWLEHGGTLPEPERARIHALTRKVTISDGELAAALHGITDRPDVLAFVLNLRDRYEQVTSPASQEPAKESQPSPNTQGQLD